MSKSDFQCDQQKEGLANNPSKMDEYCKERGFAAWFETSAKENINIEDAANCLVSKVSKLCNPVGRGVFLARHNNIKFGKLWI
jgi:ribosomal protein S27AE